jgi:antitoxin ParD1/3/4
MSPVNTSLLDSPRMFVDEPGEGRCFDTPSRDQRELNRKDRERQQMRNLLLAGGTSAPATSADTTYFAVLRKRVQSHARWL